LHAMELVTVHETNLELFEILIDEDKYKGRTAIALIDLPPDTTITMINRKETILAPRGATEILPGDILFVLAMSNKIDLVKKSILANFKINPNYAVR